MLAQREAGSLSRLQVTNGLREGGGWEDGAGLIVGAEIPTAVAADLLYSRPKELG